MIAARVEQNQKMVQSGWREYPCPCRGPCQNLFLNEVEDRNAKPVGPSRPSGRSPIGPLLPSGTTSPQSPLRAATSWMCPAQPGPGVSDE